MESYGKDQAATAQVMGKNAIVFWGYPQTGESAEYWGKIAHVTADENTLTVTFDESTAVSPLGHVQVFQKVPDVIFEIKVLEDEQSEDWVVGNGHDTRQTPATKEEQS